MAATHDREELRRLVDDLTDQQVHHALAAVRQLHAEQPQPSDTEAGLAWIGVIEDGPEDLSERVKDILRDELGRHRGPAA